MSDKAIAIAARALLDARADFTQVDVSNEPWAPASIDDAYAIQSIVSEATGPVGGWKVGAPSPDAPATFAPLPEAGIYPNDTTLADSDQRMHGIEVEIAFRLSADLPARETPYQREEVAAAIECALPVIEVVETRLSDRDAADGMWALADYLSHGELIVGEPIREWRDLEMDEVHVSLRFDEQNVVDRPCRNAGGHPLDMVVRLANICEDRCGGLKAGQIVTTGSLMGLELAFGGARIDASISGVGDVGMRFIG